MSEDLNTQLVACKINKLTQKAESEAASDVIEVALYEHRQKLKQRLEESEKQLGLLSKQTDKLYSAMERTIAGSRLVTEILEAEREAVTERFRRLDAVIPGLSTPPEPLSAEAAEARRKSVAATVAARVAGVYRDSPPYTVSPSSFMHSASGALSCLPIVVEDIPWWRGLSIDPSSSEPLPPLELPQPYADSLGATAYLASKAQLKEARKRRDSLNSELQNLGGQGERLKINLIKSRLSSNGASSLLLVQMMETLDARLEELDAKDAPQ